MKLNLRVSNLELRSCGHMLSSDEPHNTAEIVQWAGDNSYCWTIAYWEKNSDGYSLSFVTNRPFDVSSELFMQLAEKGQRMLEVLNN